MNGMNISYMNHENIELNNESGFLYHDIITFFKNKY